jgi:NADH-quinone oxidoreductase subunit M
MQELSIIGLFLEYSMILTLVGIIIGGAITLIVGMKLEKAAQPIAILSLIGALILNVLLLPRVQDSNFVQYNIVWLGDIDNPIMTLGFLGDGLSIPIAILILTLGLFSIVYSSLYMKPLNKPGLYYSLMVWFVAAMIGVVYATNLMQFFIFYELMLIPAFLLVYMYGTSKDTTERSRVAVQFWIWTAGGGIISMFAVFLLFAATGTMEISELYNASIALDTTRVIGMLFLLGFGIKLGMVPLHAWAPPVYREAPIPVLVLLSAAMTKTAAYGVIRIVIPIVSDALRTFSTGLMTLSIITMIYGAMLAISQKDLKMMLAYSSISQLGYLMFGYSTMTIIGLNGAAYQLISHGILASLMFFCAGAIEMKAGSLEFDKLGGLAPKMPVLATVFVVGALASAGSPPMSGFVSEWMIFAGAAERAVLGGIGQLFYLVLTILGVAVSVFTAGYYLWAIRRIFFGQLPGGINQAKDPSIVVLTITGFLAFIAVIIGVWPWLLWEFVNPVLLNIMAGG